MTSWLLRTAHESLRACVELVLPSSCAACGEAARDPLCLGCRAEMRRLEAGAVEHPHGRASPRPAGSGGGDGVPACWSALRLEGPVRVAVSAYKDGGRRDLGAVLAPVLASAVGRAVREDPWLRRRRALREPVLVVPVPPSPRARRRRGDDPVGDLVRRAVSLLDDDDLEVTTALRHTRRVEDQAHLGREARYANLEGALEVRRGARPAIRSSVVIAVDDVLTTGSTLREAARALGFGGARHVCAATLAVRSSDLTATALVAPREAG